jgi:GGDEF domain-containing protein
MLAGSLPARPARPVADAPLAALADGEALAKGWLMTLIAEAPLAAAAELPARVVAADGPALCSAATAALASEAELDRLRPGGDRAALAAALGELADAGDPAGVLRAVGALRAALWSALTDALARPEPELVAVLAARLGLVCDVIAAAALARSAAHAEPATAAAEPEPAPPPAEDHGPRLSPVPGAAATVPAVPVRPPALTPRSSPPDSEPAVPADVFPSAAVAPEDRAEPWATAVIRRLGSLVADGGACAVLLVDVDDADRLLSGDVRGDAAAALERAERALRDELRPGDAAVREHDGRVWIIAANTGLEGARALGHRLAGAVADAARPQGAALSASVGIGVHPDDGTDPAELVAHADEGVFAARAAGVPLA